MFLGPLIGPQGATPGGRINQGLVGAGLKAVAVAQLTEVDAVAQDPPHRRGDPAPVASSCRDAAASETVVKLPDRRSLGPLLEEPGYERRKNRIRDQLPAAVPAVAGRRPTGIDRRL
jgi:hypothetical protein